MKYPKVLRMLTLATALTVAVPCAAVPAYATEKETPEEYEERTDYELPEGWHYVLDEDTYIILEEDGTPKIEKNEPAPAEGEGAGAEGDSGEGNTENTGDNTGNAGEDGDNTGDAGNTGEGGDNTGDAGNTGEGGENTGNTGDNTGEGGDNTGNTGDNTGNTGDNAGEGGDNTGNTGDNTGNIGDNTGGDNTGNTGDNTGEGGDNTGEGEDNTGNAGDNTGNTGDSTGSGSNAGNKVNVGGKRPAATGETEENKAPAAKPDAPDYSALLEPEAPEVDTSFFMTSDEFLALRDRIQYNVEVPIEGLPSFITQEMIIGALKAQDETGYPASVTIAQIIQESGYGKYGPGGEDGEGLSYLAYQYCNLFGIKGKGTAGSAVMNTFEMTPDGASYSTKAGFRAYHTYTECIEDRSELLEEVYSDLTEDVTDANTFAVKIGRRWATDINYGRSLIRTMQKYDLYRLDDMTLVDFSKLIGRFANPCPGAVISSTFGYRTFDHSLHKGLDLGTGAENIPTYAAEAGTVTFAGEAGTAGNLIVIDHGDGLVTKYMHHEEIYVKKGDKVEKGQQIGLSGTTGYSTGNHLHFQVEENGKAVDPLKYLQDEGTGEKIKMRKKVTVDVSKVAKSIKANLMIQKLRAGLKEK